MPGPGHGLEAGPASDEEVRAWYVFDWANSPYFQVFMSSLGPILLKWLAEEHAASAMGIVGRDVGGTLDDNLELASLKIPSLGITAGSYPSIVNWVTYALQVLCLLSFSALGDFGGRRRQLMRASTFAGCFFLVLFVFCFSPGAWWFAGLIRILAGVSFIMAGVYYNAYLPLLASAHHTLVGLEGDERLRREVEITDFMSARGQLWGYAGGIMMLLLVFVLVKAMECDATTATDCSAFDRLFPPCLSIALVGVWWGLFSLYTFKHLKVRPGPELPKGAGILRVGWVEAYSTLRYVCSLKDTLLYIVFYFISSDAISTTTLVALLLLESGCPSAAAGEGSTGVTSLSGILMNSILAAMGAFIGIFVIRALQSSVNASAKTMLMWILSIYCAVALLGAMAYCEIVTAFGGLGFYLLMAPLMLMIGPMQAFSRSLFADLVPEGRESAMFAFYEITDKGSNLIGAGVIAVVHNLTESYVGTFWYLAFAFGSCCLILYFVDFHRGMAAAGKVLSLEEELEVLSSDDG